MDSGERGIVALQTALVSTICMKSGHFSVFLST